MSRLDQLKQEIRKEASDNPDKFFATDVLRQKDFKRAKCENCGKHFWRQDEERMVCGEPECGDGYTFIDDSPVDETYSYTEAWERFERFMEDRGYRSIDRYPVIARWRDDTEFVEAAIYNFQPHVVSGEVEPPAPELIVPQPSLRFNDIDNVGITGRHYVLHNHIGQTCFRAAEDYDQDRYFKDMLEFALEGLGIPANKLILHEDSWGGGGNLGACMEFFVDGLELWNQVYMFYEITEDGYQELDLKVLDMGMGHERITWISHGTETSYECVMPEVLSRMKEETGIDVNETIWKRFLPHSGKLNVDEVEDIDAKWDEIAEDMELDVEKLKEEIKPVAALYSVAEHSRALLFALADGKLPSNTGGGHNLRVIYRRASDFIERYDWDLDIAEIAEWHARELSDIFPELEKSVDEVQEILEVEEQKYQKARKEARRRLEGLESEPSVEKMVELYESHGVSPELMAEYGYEVPEDFYAQLTQEEEKKEAAEEEQFETSDVPRTEKIYYEDETRRECKAEVVAKRPNHWVALDQTVFYPEGGGQAPDRGYLVGDDDESRVTDVQIQDGVVFHHVPDHDFKVGDSVKARIDWDYRFQLMQHHSVTHMVNGAAREILGDHIWQAGAKKTEEKARLDVTHYEKLSREKLDEIEARVNEIIEHNHPITKEVLPRSKAEKRFGFRIYQGGAVPGNEIRIVDIEHIDVEACGGTHLADTGAAEQFMITRSTKVQDGVIRLEYKAGEAAKEHHSGVEERIEELAMELDVAVDVDDARKEQAELCEMLSVEPEHLKDTVTRFREENEEMTRKINDLAEYLGVEVESEQPEGGFLMERVESLYHVWKQNEKKVDDLEGQLRDHVKHKMEDRFVEEEVPTENIGLLIQIAQGLAKEYDASVTLKGQKGAVSASYHEDYDADENLEKYSDHIEGDENFAKTFKI